MAMQAAQGDTDLSIMPDPASLLATCDANLTHGKSLGELIDNALDASATIISISFGRNDKKGDGEWLVIQDNGSGCPDLIKMLTSGAHMRRAATRLGRYGVGLKEASLWEGGRYSKLTIESVHDGVHRTLICNWNTLVQSGTWRLDQGVTSRTARPGECGTRITISPLQRRVPDGKAWDELKKILGYLYTPAIKRGCRISIKRGRGDDETIERYVEPDLEEKTDVVIDVGGRKARVCVGIVKGGVINDRSGITYVFDFRVIVSNTGQGCGGYNFSRVAGFVELLGGWVLTKNKDNISRHADELYAAVFDAIKPMLAKSETKRIEIEGRAFENMISDALNAQLGAGRADAKAKRGEGEKIGPKKPTGRGGRHQRAKVDQDGDTFPRNKLPKGRLSVQPQELSDVENPGKYDRSGTVIINIANPQIGRIWSEKNFDAIMMLANGLISSAVADNDFGKTLPLFKDVENTVGYTGKYCRALGVLSALPATIVGLRSEALGVP